MHHESIGSRWVAPRRRLRVIAVHLLLVMLANYLAFWLHFDGTIPSGAKTAFQEAFPWFVAIRALTFWPFGVYQGFWRYTGLWEAQRIVAAVAASSLVGYAFTQWGLELSGYPRAVVASDTLILIFLIGAARLSAPLASQLRAAKGLKRVLIVGAGDAGEAIARDMKRRNSHEPIGFVDDNRAKIGQQIHGVPVLGTCKDLPQLVKHHDPQEVLVAVYNAAPLLLQEVVQAVRPFHVPIKRLPRPQDVHNGAAATEIQNVSIEDLIARAPVGLDELPVRRLIEGRSVLVTGAGGSIGSELCRQIAALKPATLVLYERYENNLFAIATDLADRGNVDRIHPVIGDVTDAQRVDTVMAQYRPDIVFHAAAHKHVPLMEHNVCEAVKNNVTGSRLMVEAAERHGVDRFILISSDKAVNPTSVMGATKRVAECILQLHGATSSTRFSTVRFGNVLGSNGSVVPRFLEQIKAGGPVTITHPEIRRYFMLIPEAVQLVLHAAAQQIPGLVYVLDMGEQIKLVDLAKNLILLSGFTPEAEIPITFIGLRPGEKLFEELVGLEEIVRPAATQKILAVEPRCVPDAAWLAQQIAELEHLAHKGDGGAVMRQIRVVVPEFQPPGGEPRAEPAKVPALQFEMLPPRHDLQRSGSDCPMCGSPRVTRSRTRSVAEHLHRSVTQKRLHRCLECGWRGWIMPARELLHHWTPLQTPSSRPDFSPLDRVAVHPSPSNGHSSAAQ